MVDISKIKTWKQVVALLIAEGIVGGSTITLASGVLDKILLFVIGMGLLGLIIYIVKRDFDSNQKATSGDSMLSNMASVDELVSRLRDKISQETDPERINMLRFAIDEINQYGEDLRNRYRNNN